jgi:hypothetical protein
VEEEPHWVTEIDELSEWMASRRNLIRELKYEPKRLFDVWDCHDKRGRCILHPEAYYEYMKKRFEPRDGQGLLGTYFSDEHFGKVEFERLDPFIDFNWPRKTSPGKAIPKEKYSIRWNGCIEVLAGESPRLTIGSDDGAKVWIGDRLHIDNGGKHTYRWGFASRRLTEGIHRIRIEYFQDNRDAQVVLGWLTEKEQDLPTVVPPQRLMPPGDSPDAKCNP